MILDPKSICLCELLRQAFKRSNVVGRKLQKAGDWPFVKTGGKDFVYEGFIMPVESYDLAKVLNVDHWMCDPRI